MKVGDLVVRKSYSKDITFKIIDIKENEEGITYILKGLHIRIIADSKGEDLEKVEDDFAGDKDKSFDSKMNDIIKKVILSREQKNNQLMTRGSEEDNLKRTEKEKGLVFGRPGRILHIDGDPSYMETCLKAYKQLNLNAVGIAVSEREQPLKILSLVKEYNPDIVVLTGHDGVLKDSKGMLDLNNYRNSKYFIESVKILRNYNSSYDELVIFAGACQSCYESILEAGANFASSPNRVLIHCLDPVLVCERVAYTRIDEIVSIKDVIENTITGIKGVGGLQTRGKYREGYPKSLYLN
ncbi:sporulation peptidase YabG [Clostridium perfringens]|jgi:spore coat assembly protein|uniref:Peptidase n=5 Tax=Clostridium perfringens TaxID=1502 RepID=A0A317TWB0_CLOPF|nr:sporulation peptidase YabG [Clostridium perfringens]ABG83752.1 peptidase family protein [Clostridium perfringens ATCC 13124]AOY54986.1 Sporulation-specific protease YabG [Clostridium perfringens]ATD47668.1 sporulation peptidase YabG [Clostridium perfringens]AXH53411.1 sporulation peptidase YabG [Clostridium perfringens]EDS79789.1 peptidase family protein [Clostridium perfringens C str. JGS1495]